VKYNIIRIIAAGTPRKIKIHMNVRKYELNQYVYG